MQPGVAAAVSAPAATAATAMTEKGQSAGVGSVGDGDVECVGQAALEEVLLKRQRELGVVDVEKVGGGAARNLAAHEGWTESGGRASVKLESNIKLEAKAAEN